MVGSNVSCDLKLMKHVSDLLPVPRGVIDEADRTIAFDAAIEFISSAHKQRE